MPDTLPPELVIYIAGQFESLQDVAFLSSTCRRLYAILDPLLYRSDFETNFGSALRWAAQRGRIRTMAKWVAYTGCNGEKTADALDGALQVAATAGQGEAAEFLTIQGANVECRDDMQRSPLMQAVRGGHHSTATVLLKAGADPDCHDISSEPSLFFAASQGNLAMVRLLLDYKADPYATDIMGNNPASAAAYNGHTTVVEQIADLALGPNGPEWHHLMGRVMYQAVCGASKESVEFFLQRGYCPPLNTNEGQSILEQAYARGNLDIVDLLLDNGANIDIIDALYKAGVFWSLQCKDANLLHHLLAKGADINSIDDDGKTLLMHLVISWSDKPAVLSQFLSQGPSLDVRDSAGWTALLYAANANIQEAVALLLTAGADPTTPNSQDTTPLMVAADKGHVEVVKLLLKSHPHNLSVVDDQGRSALFLAVANSCHRVVPLLLQYGADVNYRTKEGRTLLSLAAGIPHLFILRQLHAAGADINTKDRLDGRTPLMIAVANKDWKTFKLLLTYGPDLDIEDENGHNAIDCAPDAAARCTAARLIRAFLRDRAPIADP